MFVVTNRIPVAEGHETEFEDRFRKRAHLIDQSPGFIRNLVLRPVQRRFNHATGKLEEVAEQGYYLVQTYWRTEEDFWNWTKAEPLVFGFLPIGLAYHAGYSVLATITMAVLVKFAWPKHLENVQPEDTVKGSTTNEH